MLTFVFLGRLFYLQIILGAKNRALADNNRIRKITLPGPRGIIFDRQDRTLTYNLPIYRLINNNRLESLSRDQGLLLLSKNQEDKLKIDVGRNYVFGPSLAHVLGYLGEATEAEVDKEKAVLGDLVGRMGVEQYYEEKLKGSPGGELLEVDTEGNLLRRLGENPAVSGADLQLTLDARLSQVAFDALGGQKGAVVALNPQTGEVLALVSSPSFNPEKISQETLEDQDQPFFNRALSGLYPPGSIFKIVTATAGLESGQVTRETVFTDNGFLQIGQYIYKNWYFIKYGRGEGSLDIIRAIKRSNDTFFYKVGEWTGPQKIAFWARQYGLGRPTGLDLPGEAKGFVPDPESKLASTGERWFLGNTYHLAIGQGDLQVTPLQLAVLTGVVANGGQVCRPFLVGTINPDCREVGVKKSTLAIIKEGMKEACAPGGTATVFNSFSPQVACKTGTAEFNDPQERTHAWFTAFAPLDNPRIVVTVLLEAGGEGSIVAAPVAQKVLEYYFNN